MKTGLLAFVMIFALLFTGWPQAALAQDLGLELEASGTWDVDGGLSSEERVTFDLANPYFSLLGKLSFNSDGKYAPALANIPGGDFMQIYFLMEEGGIQSTIGPVSLKAGRFRHYDVLDTPYALFANSGGKSAFMMDLRYEEGIFFYESRWLELNRNAARPDDDVLGPDEVAWPDGFPDRGANLKVFGFELGNVRFGFQDAAVYSGRSFDLEYFLNPIPQYFIQYDRGTEGRPYYMDSNENNIIGAFLDWKDLGGIDLQAQFLLDDFNLAFISPDMPQQPWKAALSFAGRMETARAGRFGLYLAGATKYTFEPIDMKYYDTVGSGEAWRAAYGYTYYPDARFDINKDNTTTWSAIGLEDNSIGYQYGENNLVVAADWKGTVAGADLRCIAEFRLAGPNSPVNPWHDLEHFDPGTKWIFGEPLLEKRILVGIEAAKQLGDWTLKADLRGGVAIDALALRAPLPGSEDDVVDRTERYLWIWAPEAGLVEPIVSITLGASYSIRTK